MKKSIAKLAVRKETVRRLVRADLVRAIGGLGEASGQLAGETKDKQCPLTAGVTAG